MDPLWKYFKEDIVNILGLALAAASVVSGTKSLDHFLQWRSLSSAVELNESALLNLRSSDKRRLHVKLNGVLRSDSPIFSRNIENQPVELVFKQDWHGYTSGWTESLVNFVSRTSHASNPYIVLSPSSQKLDGPRVYISHRAMERSRALQLFNFENKILKDRAFATIYSFLFFNYPYRYTHRTYGLRNGSYVFATMDAVLDDNGEITLVPPKHSWFASTITTEHEEKYKEQRLSYSIRYAVSAACLAMASSICFKLPK